jgi:hypothetical protein
MFACNGCFACTDAIAGKPGSHRDRISPVGAWLARDRLRSSRKSVLTFFLTHHNQSACDRFAANREQAPPLQTSICCGGLARHRAPPVYS